MSGWRSYQAGRAGDPASVTLAARLREMKLPVGRLKTGTPPRLDARSIDFSVMEEQPGDQPEPVFSFLGRRDMHPRQLPCWITHTNARTHDIIRGGLDRSPMFTGVIQGVGPRYCPSIEDKIHRFAGKSSHQIFLEPEGLTTNEIYPNGISTSLPFDVQLELVHSIRGLENAHIVRPGYAIEYDYFDPRNLRPSLETKSVAGPVLRRPDQRHDRLRGSGGAGPARRPQRRRCRSAGASAWWPQRDQAYLGVLVDDLITRGVSEPYRMFTSRAEYRLTLREDNADLRLTETGRKLGLVDDAALGCLQPEARRDRTENGAPEVYVCKRWLPEKGISIYELLRRPEVTYADARAGRPVPDPAVAEQVEIQAKYEGYIDAAARRSRAPQRRRDRHALPQDLDYREVRGLSAEVQQKLNRHRPETIGQASRISGMTPAAISLLLVHLKRGFGRRQKKTA